MADSNSLFPLLSILRHKRRRYGWAPQSCSWWWSEGGRVSGRRALGHHFTLCEIAQESSAQSHGRTPPDVYSCTYTSMAHREPPWQLQRQHVRWTNPRFPLVWPLFANKWWPWSWQRKCVTDICSRAPGLGLMTLSPATSSSYPEASQYIRSPIRGVIPYSGDGVKQRAVRHCPPATTTAGVETSRRVYHFFFSSLHWFIR